MMKKHAILFAAIFMVLACTMVTVYAEDDEGDEDNADEAGEKEESSGGSDDSEKSIPGFEFAFAAVALGFARLIKACLQ